jgi:hypothetical protein
MKDEGGKDEILAEQEERSRDGAHCHLPLPLAKGPGGGDKDVGNEVRQQGESREPMENIEIAIGSPSAAGDPAFETQPVGMSFAEQVLSGWHRGFLFGWF